MDIEANRYQQDAAYLYEGQQSSSSEEFSTKSLINSPSFRIQFIRKVYSILLTQLLLTALVCYAGMYNPTFGAYLITSPATLVLSIIVSLSILLAMFCNKNVSRIVPANYILLGLFTVCESYIVSFFCALISWTESGQPDYEGRNLVLLAAFFTIGITISLTVYAFTTKQDFSFCGGLLFVMLSSFILSSILLVFYNNYVLEIVACSITAIIYGIYIVYDTQIVVGGKYFELSIDDYILGALMLYIDIIRLFLRILEIIIRSKGK
ncbi:inhibitor of apoptosis-promoting Bax1 protein (macronuclear) [Tetrahymena thermophila SB210]|uniref:Inhibitor of apoptosis-promoting Bax1 protein n=1 Tax=Tetrahymena thermophila (strain SB210) TaxID=312017 RepID=Q22LZ0_TETTS|nr:inhibitor of apoptosis-promoting Bax1 protein [Tetrahymena thermophila SB210]EAR86393.1 inhibitor of apoptosis-promoting Bax1 protein [Tetrahymena thermophila SB210]|eukprot:XP_977230.1 inhibitor of apoptosis-promoting Bax1 protein [Tetrahymena thermophila SB210]